MNRRNGSSFCFRTNCRAFSSSAVRSAIRRSSCEFVSSSCPSMLARIEFSRKKSRQMKIKSTTAEVPPPTCSRRALVAVMPASAVRVSRRWFSSEIMSASAFVSGGVIFRASSFTDFNPSGPVLPSRCNWISLPSRFNAWSARGLKVSRFLNCVGLSEIRGRSSARVL